jgi:hypothetical protein
MANEIVLTTPESLGGLKLTQSAVNAFLFAKKYAGVELDEETTADVISLRKGLNIPMRELTEFRKGLENLCKEIKEYTEHLYNIGSFEDLPDGEDGVKVSWSKQSYTYEWSAYGASCQVVEELESRGICTKDTALCELTVDAVIRASGITKEKLIDMFPDAIVAKPKKRTLSFK